MNQELLKKLKDWRNRKAQSESIARYMVMHNKTLEEIANRLPKNKDEFQAIKGLGGKKFEKYGEEILEIVNGVDCHAIARNDTDSPIEEKVYSVSNFLNFINLKLSEVGASVQGEISSVDIRERYLFFTIKDAEDDSSMDCFMWANDYELSGIELEEGLEIITHGRPEIYKRTGRFSFQVEALEMIGEGILKKKYEKLKKQLASEGLFEIARKKPIPAYPQKIGLITSKDGAVINDFQSNIGKYGYKISFVDSRVEGPLAVKELISSIKYFRDKAIDVLVIIRGGGSLESLQAFNNEILIREIVNYPVPVICGIGHDKDVPLFSMVADKAFSTPTAVAREINKSWDQAVEKIGYYESNILNKYRILLGDYKNTIDRAMSQAKNYYGKIVAVFEIFDQFMDKIISHFIFILRKEKLKINNYQQIIEQNNPERQLKLGYSIMFSNGNIVKSISQIKEKDLLKSRLNDGEVISIIDKINNKEQIWKK